MLIVRQGMTVTFAGVVAGLVGALLATRFMTSLLFGVSATDPHDVPGHCRRAGLTALLASYVPARRAARIDPMVSLRSE